MKAAEQHAPNKSNVTSKSANLSEKPSELTVLGRRVALYVTLSLGFFLLGFVPMWFKANSAMEQRDAAQREVRLSQLQNTLGTAMIDVQRGEYEPARQIISDFYTNLRSQIEAGSASVFTPAQREKLRPLLVERDDVITLLARSDPAAADRLFAIYSSYKKLDNGG
ncbi:MAG TPA: hypothetical protein VJ180_12955 [Pyrinomonadaceae bacterium]|nr:hypothetical protein [Pyrinomonadaceae bacterium]